MFIKLVLGPRWTLIQRNGAIYWSTGFTRCILCSHKYVSWLPSLKLTACTGTWKWMVGRLVFVWVSAYFQWRLLLVLGSAFSLQLRPYWNQKLLRGDPSRELTYPTFGKRKIIFHMLVPCIVVTQGEVYINQPCKRKVSNLPFLPKTKHARRSCRRRSIVPWQVELSVPVKFLGDWSEKCVGWQFLWLHWQKTDR